MFFRFGAAVCLVVLIALAGTALEKHCLTLRRSISHQEYQKEVLLERLSELRLEAQRKGTPASLLTPLEEGTFSLERPEKPIRESFPRPPLLNWSQRPEE